MRDRSACGRPGESFTHVDGCNSCQCTAAGGACTRRFCLAGGVECGGRGQGEQWQHTDGCNTCICGILGPVCTEYVACWPIYGPLLPMIIKSLFDIL